MGRIIHVTLGLGVVGDEDVPVVELLTPIFAVSGDFDPGFAFGVRRLRVHGNSECAVSKASDLRRDRFEIDLNHEGFREGVFRCHEADRTELINPGVRWGGFFVKLRIVAASDDTTMVSTELDGTDGHRA